MARQTPDFNAKYVTTNLRRNAPIYNEAKFKGWLMDLNMPEYGPAIMTAILCGQRRGDIVPNLFRSLIHNLSDEAVLELFSKLSEALTLIFVFVGLPNCMPACLGLVAELRSRDLKPSSVPRRPAMKSQDWVQIGREQAEVIYSGVGNPEVRVMISEYFADLSHVSNAAVFGYCFSGSCDVQPPKISELTVASAIFSMGATRQAQSHCKAALGMGNTVSDLKNMTSVAIEIARWNNHPLEMDIDIERLATDMREHV